MRRMIFILIFVFLISSFCFADENNCDDFIEIEYMNGIKELKLVDDYIYEKNDDLTSEERMNIAINNALECEEIVRAEKIYSINESGLPDGLVSSQDWRFEYTNLDKVWDDLDEIPYLKGQSNPIIVAVIDTGVKTDHPDLNLILSEGIDVADEDNVPTDYRSHGTHVTGIVGAKKEDTGDHVVGFAPDVQILPIKVYENNGVVNTFYLEKGIRYAIDHGADVITMSLSFPEYIVNIETLLEEAENKGIVVIAGVGNESNNWIDGEHYNERYIGQERRRAVLEYPAAFDTVLAVGAVAKSTTKDEIAIADYSSISGEYYGDQRNVDVVAPGSRILSTHYQDDTMAMNKSGTSMATPHVAGYVALLMGKYPQLTAAQIREVVRTTASDPDILIPDGYNRKDTIGYGLIDIQAGLNFSPLVDLAMENLIEFKYNPLVYNQEYHVSNDISNINISSTIMQGAMLKINGEETFSKDIYLKVGENILNIKAELNGVVRNYTYKIIRENFEDGLVKNINIAGDVVTSVSKLKEGEFQVVVENGVAQVDIEVVMVHSDSLITFDCQLNDYSQNGSKSVVLDEATTAVAFKIKESNGNETRYSLFIPHEKDLIRETEDLPLYTNEVIKEVIVEPSEVTIQLNAEIIALEYGLDADDFLRSYTFLASVKGTTKKDVIWSLNDETYAIIDQNGKVTTKEDVPSGMGLLIITVKATTVVGGVSDTATIYFVEENPLGSENFSAPYISGYSDGTFRPQNNISRAEIATIFTKILMLNLDNPGAQKFDDVNEDYWGYPYIQAVQRTGIFSGYFEDGKWYFRPDKAISRAELAQIFTNYWKYKNVEVDASKNHEIPDVSSSYWASDPIHRLYNTGIFTGYLNGAYRPEDDSLREQVVNMINKLIERPPLNSEVAKFNDVANDYQYYGDIEAASNFYFREVEEELPIDIDN